MEKQLPNSTQNAGATAPTGTTAPTALTNPTAHLTALKGLLQPFTGSEKLDEQDVIQFLHSVKKLAKLCSWDDEKTILATDLSLTEDAKNFAMALKAQDLFPTTFKDLETMLIERFYMLKTATDRERLAATMKMASAEKVRSFVDRIKIATHRLATSSRLEAIQKEKDKDKKR